MFYPKEGTARVYLAQWLGQGLLQEVHCDTPLVGDLRLFRTSARGSKELKNYVGILRRHFGIEDPERWFRAMRILLQFHGEPERCVP